MDMIIVIQMLYLMVSLSITSFVSTFISSSVILYLCYDNTMLNLLMCSIIMGIGITILGVPCFIAISLIHGYVLYLYNDKEMVDTVAPEIKNVEDIEDNQDYDYYVDVPLDPIEITVEDTSC